MELLTYADGTYRSPARRPPAVCRWLPGLALYGPFLRTVLCARRQAVRGRFDQAAVCRYTTIVLRQVERTGVAVEVSGIQHLQGLDTPCVVIANHMSTMETVILPAVIGPVQPVTFIVKQSLLTYPVFGPIMRAMDPVPVTRTNPRQDLKTVLDAGTERLARGLSIVVFPQTTRTVAFDPAQFTSIGSKLAQRAGVPIVPLALLTDAWGNGRWIKEFGRVDPRCDVRFAFGPPLPVQRRGAEEHAAVVEFITTHLRGWSAARVARGLPPLPLRH